MSDLIRYGQEHLLAHWDTLTEDEKKNLYNEIKVKLTLFYLCSSVFCLKSYIFSSIWTLDLRKFICSDRKISRTLTPSKKSAISFAIMVKDYSHNMWHFLISWTTNIKPNTFHRIFAVVRIRDILVRIRIRILLFSYVTFGHQENIFF